MTKYGVRLKLWKMYTSEMLAETKLMQLFYWECGACFWVTVGEAMQQKVGQWLSTSLGAPDSVVGRA